MSNLIKEYKTKLKVFQYLGVLVILSAVIFMINYFDPNSVEMKSKVFSYGALAGFFGAFLIYFGFKERRLQIYEDKIEYHTSKLVFSSSYDDLALIKSFQEQGKKSEYLILMKENDEVLKLSDAFFPQEYLRDTMTEISKICEKNNISIEDDLKWLD